MSPLALIPAPGFAVAGDIETRQFSRDAAQDAALTPLDSALLAPPLRLRDINQQIYALGEQGKKVVLINFWASWCSPCVKEIPSLHRLRDKIKHPDLEIVTVNVGEERARIARFLERVPVELPLLMDNEGIVASAWKVYVYPSNYLVDRQGTIRYAYLGALEWDSPKNITIIQNLLKQR